MNAPRTKEKSIDVPPWMLRIHRGKSDKGHLCKSQKVCTIDPVVEFLLDAVCGLNVPRLLVHSSFCQATQRVELIIKGVK